MEIRIVTADVSGFLTMLHGRGVSIFEVRRPDDLTLQLRISAHDLHTVKKTAERFGGTLRVLTETGVNKRLRSFLRRPVLFLGVLLVTFLTYFLPTRILFVEIEGNSAVADAKILECAEACGVYPGTTRRDIRSEEIKNRLLQMLPQLEWVGVNSYGCRAVISVTERELPLPSENAYHVSSIVAQRDGIISSCTVTSGNLLCKPGQAVKAGQTLISGYTDCGLTIQATRAEGEVYAQTMHTVKVVVPADCDQKGSEKEIVKKYSLILGKKRINFYKDSGILDTGCDKMYTEYVLTLPGGFKLPVAVLVQTQVVCSLRQTSQQLQDVSQVAAETADRYLQQQMISGVINSSSVTKEYKDGVYVLVGQYRCTEMIGRIHGEEILDIHGKDY